MSLTLPQLAITGMLSMKREMKIIFATFLVIATLPLLTAVLITQVGINALGSVLATSDPQGVTVDIHDPGTGQIVDHISGLGIWPVGGPVSLEFGESDLPYQPYHTGIDIASPNRQVGDPVGAFMDGTVTYAGSVNWGFGTHVEIDNGHHVTSIYAHLDTLGVVVGQVVKTGDIIGTRGTTGWSTGPHLHFQIKVYGVPVNPRIFLKGNP
jgi:murein DD-endopeptidase MepM/ murein hydrolase activator NlpD